MVRSREPIFQNGENKKRSLSPSPTTFLDTNILIYAQGTGPKSEVARQLILAGGTVSVQVLNESTSVLHHKFGLDWSLIAEAVAGLQTALGPIRPIAVNTHSAAVDLARVHGFSFYDSLIVASALEARCDILVKEDLRAGRRIGNLTIVNPFLQNR